MPWTKAQQRLGWAAMKNVKLRKRKGLSLATAKKMAKNKA